MNMFDSFRDKILSVQEGITASFQRIAVGDGARRCPLDESIDLNAGADLLNYYQTEWQNGHQMAEENAHKAQEVDAVIEALYHTFEKQWSDITQLSGTVAAVPQLITSTQALMEQLGDLQEMFDEVEHNLLQLEDTVETQELQERQLDHRFQLALYKEKKLQELDRVRESLVAEYAEKVGQHETRQRQTLKERQETFGQAFQADLELYKKSGVLPSDRKRGTTHQGPSLEEVTLDDDTVALDKFLADSTNCGVAPPVDPCPQLLTEASRTRFSKTNFNTSNVELQNIEEQHYVQGQNCLLNTSKMKLMYSQILKV